MADADLILDGTDNFETRYLINDAAVKLNKPWIFGGVLGSEGQTMTIRPGVTPCLRCLIEDNAAAGDDADLRDSGRPGAGGRGHRVVSRRSRQSSSYPGRLDELNTELIMVNLCGTGSSAASRWRACSARSIALAASAGKFEWLAGDLGSHTTTLCGRNAVQVAARRPEPLDFTDMARRLTSLGEVKHNAFMLRFAAEGHDFTVFPDGRAIIKGTNDIAKARSLYAQFVGS